MSDTDPFVVTSDSGITFAAFQPSYSQIDEMHVDLVNRKLLELVTSLDQPTLVLDMSHVDFFGSSFIEAMFRAWKRLQNRAGSKFALCGLNPYCREVLEITHLDKLWTLCPTRNDAIAHFKSA